MIILGQYIFHALESVNPFTFERYTPKYSMSKKFIVSWVMAMCNNGRIGSEEDSIMFGVSVTLAITTANATQRTVIGNEYNKEKEMSLCTC